MTEHLQEIYDLARPELLELHAYSAARTTGKQDVRIYLDANENPYPPFPADGTTENYNRYPAVQPLELREVFAERYGVSKEMLFLSRGADEAIDLVTRIFCNAARDAVVLTPPAFPMYEHAARVQGARLVEVPLTSRDFQLDMPNLLSTFAGDENIKLMMVASPNNPTATLMKRADMLTVAKALRGKGFLVVDELYLDYSGAASLATEIGENPNIIVLRSLSKEHSLAGERVGITIAHPTVVDLMRRVAAPYILARSAIAAATAVASPEGEAHSKANIERILSERKEVENALEQLDAVVRVYPSDANFLLVEFTDAVGLVAAMEDAGIKVRDRSSLAGLDGCVRISIGTPEENSEMLAVVEKFGGVSQ